MTGNPALTCLSLKGCSTETEDVQLICTALKTDTAMVALLLSEDRISLGHDEQFRNNEVARFDNGVPANGAGQIIYVPEDLRNGSSDGWTQVAQFQASKLKDDFCSGFKGWRTRKYF